MSTATKKPASGGVGRVANSDSASSSNSSLSRSASQRSSTATPPGHARTRSVRAGTPVSARAAIVRRDTGGLSNAESDARAEAASAVEDLQQRLEKEEKTSEQYRKQLEVHLSKLEDAIKESAKLEEKVHEHEEHVEALKNEKREATRQIREMESIYEAERSAILKEKEEMANREEEMQTVIQRLKDSLAQRNNGDEEWRPSRQANSSPSLEGNSFAPPSSLQRSDSRSSSKLILQKDKLIESLRLELAEAQIKLVESENQGGGRLQEVERQLMEARMANARLMEDNESYQLLLQEKTLKGDFGQSDFSYMGSNSNQDALNALEGKTGGSSLADELSEADEAGGESEGDRRLETELKSMKEQNKALTLYINKIIERLLQHQDFESILDTSTDLKGDTNKDASSATGEKRLSGLTLIERAKSIASGPSKPRQRPMSVMPMAGPKSDHNDPDKAPSIPIGNLTRSASTRRSRPQSEQFTGAASLISQMYKGPDGPASPSLGNPRNSQSFFSPAPASSNPNAAARIPSNGQTSTTGNFPGVRSESSSISGESGDISTPPSQSPPRSQSDKGTTFAGGKPRPLRLVQENPDAVNKENKRASWMTGWSWGKKDKDETSPANGSIPE